MPGIKNLFQEMGSLSETCNEELLSVSHYAGVTLKRESLENEDETPVSLCNSVDVYKYVYIANDLEFMNATATENG